MGCPTAAKGVGGSNVLFSPVEAAAFYTHVWGAAPDFCGDPVRFVYVFYPRERQYACGPQRVQAEWWRNALRPLLELLSFDFYQAADCYKHSPILMLRRVFLYQLFPH